MKMAKRKMSRSVGVKCLVALLLLSLMVGAPFLNNAPQVALAEPGPLPVLRILEVQPGTEYELNETDFAGLGFYVELTQMPIVGFISKVYELNGHYDVIYIGNNTYEDYVKNHHFRIEKVTHFGETSPTNKITIQYDAVGVRFAEMDGRGIMNTPQRGYDNAEDSVEHYSPNDITNRRARRVKSLINSGQLVIMDDTIFTDLRLSNTRLVSNFGGFKASGEIVTTTNITANFIITNLANFNRRPTLEITARPLDFTKTGTQEFTFNGKTETLPVFQYNEERIMSFRFNATNNNVSAGSMVARLYIDINGNGIFLPEEIVKETEHITSNEGFTINYRVPDNFTGLQPWKLELEDRTTGAKSYQLGFTAFRGTPLNVRVLQLTPPKERNEFSIATQLRVPLSIEDEYSITVVEMEVDDWDRYYPNPHPTSGLPTQLVGNYDMVILGFDDIYGGGDITDPDAIAAIKHFIDTGQSIMFTHDNITFRTHTTSGWGGNMTKEFRDMVGQSIYAVDAYFPKRQPRHADMLPVPPRMLGEAGKGSFGFTRLTLDRANNNNYFPTSTVARRVNQGLLTMYPFHLDKDLAIAKTHHQYLMLDLEDENLVPWFNLLGSDFNHYDARNDFYTYTIGNITYSGTGHSSPAATHNLDEHMFFLNTIIKAARGANLAPIVEFTNLVDEQIIPKSRVNMEFEFIATDMNLPRDKSIAIELFIQFDSDDDGDMDDDQYVRLNNFLVDGVTVTDGLFSVDSGVITGISFIKGDYLPVDEDEFLIKIVAKDTLGAEGFAEVELEHLDIPTLSIEAILDGGYLVGDTADIDLRIFPENITGETDIELRNIKLTVIPDARTDKYELVSGEYVNLIYDLVIDDGSTSWSEKIESLSIKINKVVHSSDPLLFTYSLTYDIHDDDGYLIESYVSPTQEFRISSKSGEILIDVKDVHGIGVENVEIEITRVTPPGITINTTTGVLGFYNQTGLLTGEYTVKITPPTGFEIYGSDTFSDTFTVNLSYNNPVETLNYTLTPGELDNVSITDYFGNAEVISVVDGVVNAKINFELMRHVEELKLQLTTDITSLAITANKILKGGIEISPPPPPAIIVDGLKLTISDALVPGSYAIYLVFQLGNNVSIEGVYKVDISTITTTILEFDNVFTIDAAELTITVEEDPELW